MRLLWRRARRSAGRALVILVLVTVGASAFFVGRATGAPAGEPGSEADPVVSKSYVDQFIVLQVVSLTPGQVFRGEAGTEIILRAGRATAITTLGGGLADTTAGRDVGQGETIAPNHLLVVPRSDGRGFKAVTDVIAIVRGSFAISQP